MEGRASLCGFQLVLEEICATNPTLRDGIQAWKNWDLHKQCSVVVVVFPLISLIVNQVESLRNRGVYSSIITSGSDLVKPYLVTQANLCNDSLLLCAPETLALPKWRRRILLFFC